MKQISNTDDLTEAVIYQTYDKSKDMLELAINISAPRHAFLTLGEIEDELERSLPRVWH